MSNIYIQEPPTSGKVLLKTTVGDIDIELWTRECPKTCRNFIQLCMDGYYNNTIFHRIVKDFIVQGGDPNGDGTGGDSIYGEPFKDEFHSRLRYTRRGLVGMANSGKDDNGSQFFFTMAPTPELQNKNTLFAKVTGDTVFNMLRLEEGLVDHNERPMYPQKILRTEILNNPFEDIVPRVIANKDEQKEKKKKREKGVKNFGLLSFGEEAEEDEEQTNEFVKQNAGKAKSMHDVVDDPTLSKDVIKIEKTDIDEDEQKLADDNAIQIKDEPDDTDERRKRIREKLQSKMQKNEPIVEVKKERRNSNTDDGDGDDDVLLTLDEERKQQRQQLKAEIRQKIQTLKKEYQTDKKVKDEMLEKKAQKPKAGDKLNAASAEDNELIKEFIEEREKYSDRIKQLPKKGANREVFTLSLLSKFRAKLDAMKQKQEPDEQKTDTEVIMDDREIEKDLEGDEWMAHTLRFQDQAPVLAKDASTKGDDWYDVYDPRNPLNKRKRGEGTTVNNSNSSSSSKRRK